MSVNYSDIKPKDIVSVSSTITYDTKVDDASKSCEKSLTNDDQDALSSSTPVVIEILSVDGAIREHKSKDGKKQLAWDSFKYHFISNIEARYWVGHYYYHHGEDIPELQKISKEERTKIALDIFKETADKGHPLAKLKYRMYLLQSSNVPTDLENSQIIGNIGNLLKT